MGYKQKLEEMKASELRIGNLVLAEIGTGLPQIHEVQAGDIEAIHLKKVEVFHIYITEGWLLKAGFIKDRDRDSYYIDIENGYNKFDIMYFNGVVYLKSRYDSENLDTQAIPHIKYVHQLQNLYFALTGEELEYNAL